MSAVPDTAGRTLRDVLAFVVGVWEGSYMHLSPAGDLLERFASRQETRIEGDNWFERVVYRPAGPDRVVRDFRGHFTPDGDVVIADPSFEGRSRLVGDRYLLFPYRWTDEPTVEVVELITLATPEYRTRMWQRFRAGRLDRVTVIEERRCPGEVAAAWH